MTATKNADRFLISPLLFSCVQFLFYLGGNMKLAAQLAGSAENTESIHRFQRLSASVIFLIRSNMAQK
jgi:hypothetical protein